MAATKTFDRKEITNIRSLNKPSKTERNAPKTASKAATTAIGKYGWSQIGTVG